MVDYVNFARVRYLPEFCSVDTVYFVQPNAGDPVRMFITGDDAVPVEIAAATAVQQLFDAGLIDVPTVAAMAAYLTGPSGTLAIGTVTTGESGSDAVVTNVGTPSAAVWNIRLPRGMKGEVGASDAQVDTFAAAKSFSYIPTIVRIVLAGRATRGDGGGGAFVRTDTVPAASGLDIWWFTAADGSRWQIEPADQHMAAQFGALGAVNVDVRPLLNAAFLAPMVSTINLGPLTHFVAPQGILVPPGKSLIGVNRAVSWIKVLPHTTLQSGPGQAAVLHLNDTDGLSQDYSIDCQRSHYGIGTHGYPHGVGVWALAGGSCIRTRIRRVDVYNCWGYAHYTTTGVPGQGVMCLDVTREDCRAINFDSGFEETGTIINCRNTNTYADASALDGGPLLPTECHFHQYGDIRSFKSYNPIGRGKSQSCVSIFNTDGQNIGTIEYYNPDIDVDCDNGVFVQARNAAGTGNPADGALNTIDNFRIYGGRIRATSKGGIIRGATAKIFETELIGLNGEGLEAGEGANIELHAPTLIGNRPAGGSTAAFGLNVNGSGVRKWFGSGRIVANGPAESAAVSFFAGVSFFGTQEFFPAIPSGTPSGDPVRYDKIFSKPSTTWITDTVNSPETGYNNYYLSITLPNGGITNRAKTSVSLSPLDYTQVYVSGSVPGFIYSAKVFWIDNLTLRIYITTKFTITNWVANVRVTEFV